MESVWPTIFIVKIVDSSRTCFVMPFHFVNDLWRGVGIIVTVSKRKTQLWKNRIECITVVDTQASIVTDRSSVLTIGTILLKVLSSGNHRVDWSRHVMLTEREERRSASWKRNSCFWLLTIIVRCSFIKRAFYIGTYDRTCWRKNIDLTSQRTDARPSIWW